VTQNEKKNWKIASKGFPIVIFIIKIVPHNHTQFCTNYAQTKKTKIWEKKTKNNALKS